jgi:hypothetical protein
MPGGTAPGERETETMTTTALPIALPRITTVAELRVFLDKSPLLASPSYFFSPGAMRFFDSRVLRGLYVVEEEADRFRALFITSERYDETSPRLYTVRVVTLTADRLDDGSTVYRQDIDQVGEFQAYDTAAAARRFAARADLRDLPEFPRV